MYRADDDGDFDPTVMIGAQVGRYRLGRQLGAGSMADVFEATDLETGEQVAVKVLNERASAVSEVVARFVREGRALQKMNHPNIVRVLDHGVTPAGDAWIAMERLGGASLDMLLKQRTRLGLDQALRIAKDVATALAVVHARGMIHRDVKPENVFVTQVDSPNECSKLIDFGVAHVTNDDLGVDSVPYTRAGSLLGSMAFMAPEQLNGGVATAASDVFSLAVTLYEMLSGELPFEGTNTTEQVVRARTANKIVPLRKRVKHIALPADLDALLIRALSHDPGARPMNGAAFAAELSAIRALVATGTYPVVGAASVRPPRWSSRPPLVLGPEVVGLRAGTPSGAPPALHAAAPAASVGGARTRSIAWAVGIGLMVLTLLGVVAALTATTLRR